MKVRDSVNKNKPPPPTRHTQIFGKSIFVEKNANKTQDLRNFGRRKSIANHMVLRPKGHVFFTLPRAQNMRFPKIINFRVFRHFSELRIWGKTGIKPHFSQPPKNPPGRQR